METIRKATTTKAMSIKGIDNENTAKAIATRDKLYTIHTTQIHPTNTLNMIQVNEQQQASGKNGSTSMRMTNSKCSRQNFREGENANLLLQERQSRRQSVRFQPVLREVTCEQNIRGSKDLPNSCVIRITD